MSASKDKDSKVVSMPVLASGVKVPMPTPRAQTQEEYNQQLCDNLLRTAVSWGGITATLKAVATVVQEVGFSLPFTITASEPKEKEESN